MFGVSCFFLCFHGFPPNPSLSSHTPDTMDCGFKLPTGKWEGVCSAWRTCSKSMGVFLPPTKCIWDKLQLPTTLGQERSNYSRIINVAFNHGNQFHWVPAYCEHLLENLSDNMQQIRLATGWCMKHSDCSSVRKPFQFQPLWLFLLKPTKRSFSPFLVLRILQVMHYIHTYKSFFLLREELLGSYKIDLTFLKGPCTPREFLSPEIGTILLLLAL